MEQKSTLTRSQSLRSVHSSRDKPAWMDAKIVSRTVSVSKLVERYQVTTEDIRTDSKENGRTKAKSSVQANTVATPPVTRPKERKKPQLEPPKTKADKRDRSSVQATTVATLPRNGPQEIKKPQLESPKTREDKRERSVAETSLSRSRSMGSLQNNTNVFKLVERYQVTTEDIRTDSKENGRTKAKSSVQGERKKPQLEPPKSKADKRDRSLAETSLSRSKSTGSLQNNANVSIEDLKARFEMRNKPVRAADEPKPSKDVKPVMNGKIKKSTEKQKTADAPAQPRKSDEKERDAPHKVVTQTWTERRKTTGGHNIEKTVAAEADEKRRSVADFRENSFAQERDVCISVKALSALYLSKVASQEAQLIALKPAQDQSSELGRRVIQMKMEEDTQLNREDHLRQGPDNNPETRSQQFSQSQTSKESLYQQRQKCELRRLLKHTHPELKMLDQVVDEELAEVLSSEAEVAADESGYEGEVRSRRLIFENCSQSGKASSHTPKMLTTEAVEKGNVSKTSAVFEHSNERACLDRAVASSPDPNRECEDVKKRDVQATRRIFESQCVDASQSCPEKVQGNVSTPGVLTELVQELEKNTLRNWTEQPKKRPLVAGHSTVKEDDELSSHEVQEHQDSIKTKALFMQNNPFISKNIEHSYAHMAKPKIAAEDDCAAKVKDRTHLFESMPFDQIRHQNKDEVETMVETLKESLSSLHHLNAIHAHGSIIEVNETMRAKKAKYTKLANGAEIDYDEVCEGNFQNFILRVLPRANLKPQVTYLTEGCDGAIQCTLVNVPVHSHQFTGNQDTECNTANVVQLVEDILNRDNSLRKGVIIQEAADKSADVAVYSLYKYSDEEDVRRYSPQEYSEGTDGRISPLISPDSACRGSVSPDVTTKGNVKLFKSCIEKGELEYLKTLQEKSTVEEPMLGQYTDIDPERRVDLTVEDTPEWAPVDIKRLRSMFSKDQMQSQSNQIVHKDLPHGSETQQEEEEIVFQGKLKAALDSLERSNINVTRGDFKAAMIYRNSSKPLKERLRNTTQVSSDEAINQDVCVMESQPQKSRRPIGPKPAIPPKPEHLKVKQQNNQSTNNENSFKLLKDTGAIDTDKQTRDMSEINTGIESEHDRVSHGRLGEGSQKPQEITEKHQIHESSIAVEKHDKDDRGQKKGTVQQRVAEDILVEEKTTETEEAHINFNEACKKFGGMNDLPKKRPPVKPKRVKIAQPDNLTQVDAELQTPLLCHSCCSTREQKDTKNEKGLKQEGKVELRAKKGRTETEDERRQRLSVHMDEIMRGNIGTAMEIFDNLRKQEELRGILGRVKEIEEDTSEVDVRSLREVFEVVPDWVVSSNKKKPKQAKAERKEETTTSATESKSSMAHVFGNLERASEEIMSLKEQTLARLVDIEEAIKKALYSVSTLKSESDIAGLSCLFKETLGSVQGSPASGNIHKISIGSSKTASLQVKEGPTASADGQNASTERTPKPREGSPCSPAFISIQSAARKSDKPEMLICPTCQHSPEKFCSTKLLQCNSPTFSRKEPTDCFPQREISILEVQTDREGNRMLGTKTATEDYKRTDTRGNRIYSSATPTVVTTEPETRTSSTDLRVTGPALHHVAAYPDILLPVNQNP
ncbi:xin actin-binding repeat-containing protein 1-like [Festucalex cinctus]